MDCGERMAKQVDMMLATNHSKVRRRQEEPAVEGARRWQRGGTRAATRGRWGGGGGGSGGADRVLEA